MSKEGKQPIRVIIRSPEALPERRYQEWHLMEGDSITLTDLWMGISLPDLEVVLAKALVKIEGVGTNTITVTTGRRSGSTIALAEAAAKHWAQEVEREGGE